MVCPPQALSTLNGRPGASCLPKNEQRLRTVHSLRKPSAAMQPNSYGSGTARHPLPLKADLPPTPLKKKLTIQKWVRHDRNGRSASPHPPRPSHPRW